MAFAKGTQANIVAITCQYRCPLDEKTRLITLQINPLFSQSQQGGSSNLYLQNNSNTEYPEYLCLEYPKYPRIQEVRSIIDISIVFSSFLLFRCCFRWFILVVKYGEFPLGYSLRIWSHLNFLFPEYKHVGKECPSGVIIIKNVFCIDMVVIVYLLYLITFISDYMEKMIQYAKGFGDAWWLWWQRIILPTGSVSCPSYVLMFDYHCTVIEHVTIPNYPFIVSITVGISEGPQIYLLDRKQWSIF